MRQWIRLAAVIPLMAAVVTPAVSYPLLVPPLVLAGLGSALFFAPLASAMLSAVAFEEQGQASGAAMAIRELAAVFGVAVLGLVFAGHGGYASRPDFVSGFVPAMWLAAGVAAAGVLAAAALPAGSRAADGVVCCRTRRRSAPGAFAVRACPR